MSKEQLLDSIWPEVFVEEKTLSQNIFVLRKTLGMDEEGQQYVETVPKHGYRFRAEVSVLPRGQSEVVKIRRERTEFLFEEEISTVEPLRSAAPATEQAVADAVPATFVQGESKALSAQGAVQSSRHAFLRERGAKRSRSEESR